MPLEETYENVVAIFCVPDIEEFGIPNSYCKIYLKGKTHQPIIVENVPSINSRKCFHTTKGNVIDVDNEGRDIVTQKKEQPFKVYRNEENRLFATCE